MDPVTDRQQSVAEVLSTHRRFSRSTARALENLVAPVLEPGKPVPDFVYLQQLLADRLDLHWRRLSEADDASSDAQTERRALIEARDGEVALLYREVVDLRTILRGRFGVAPSKNFIGLRGDTSRDPRVLLRQADRAVARLRDAGHTPPPSKLPCSLADRQRWAAPVADAARSLRTTVDRVATASKIIDATRLDRRRALASFNDAFVLIAGLFEAAYRLIGRPDLAEGVRPSRRHPGKTYLQEKRGSRPASPKKKPKPRSTVAIRLVAPIRRFFGQRRSA